MKKYCTLKTFFLALLLAIALNFSISSPANALEKMSDNCKKYTENTERFSDDNCWTCSIFMLFFDAANDAAGQINQKVAGPAIKVMVVFFGLWLVFNTVIFFGSVTGDANLEEYLTKIGGMMFKTGFAAVFLTGGATVAFDYFINPVLTTSASLGIDILNSADSAVSCSFAGGSGSASANAPLSPELRGTLECFIKAIAAGMAKSLAIAAGLRCGSLYWLPLDIFDINVPNPIMFLVGVFLGCLYWWIGVLFSMTMLDVIFRIGIFIGMLPLFIVAWVFPMTTSFAKKGWDLFFHSSMVFTIASLLVAIVVKMVEQAWGYTTSASDSRLDKFNEAMNSVFAGAYVEAWDTFWAAALGDLCVVMFISFWGLKIAPKADQLSAEYIGGSKPPESCGVRALKACIDLIINAIMLIITILTVGLGAVMYVARIAQFVAKSAEAVEKAKKMMKAIRDLQKKAKEIQKKAKKIKKGVDMARSAVDA